VPKLAIFFTVSLTDIFFLNDTMFLFFCQYNFGNNFSDFVAILLCITTYNKPAEFYFAAKIENSFIRNKIQKGFLK